MAIVTISEAWRLDDGVFVDTIKVYRNHEFCGLVEFNNEIEKWVRVPDNGQRWETLPAAAFSMAQEFGI